MNSTINEFYDGSNIFLCLTDMTGLSIDKVNFLASQLFALPMGLIFREYLSPQKCSPTTRHLFQILIGLPMTYFCFGRQIIHLLFQSLICFLLMFSFDCHAEKLVLMAAMAYLCLCHTYRTIYDYGGYTLDITGPLMLNTQRLSSLAYGIKDGRKMDLSYFSKSIQERVVRKFPSILEYLSYVFSFHGLMCGPFCFYSDYIHFIEGSTLQFSHNNSHKYDHILSNGDQDHSQNGHVKRITQPIQLPPSPGVALYEKLGTASFYGMMTICVLPRFPQSIVTGPEFEKLNFFLRHFKVLLYAALQRQKYYFAWKLGESVNTCAGLGYNGMDKNGRARWDLIDNANIWKVETSTSLKELLDNWNRSTTLWLRYIIYDRCHSTVPVMFFSAFWHGFYAGYYWTFLTGGLLVHTARLMRKYVRPWFKRSELRSFVYDCITFTCTRVAVAYLGFPFLVLDFWQTYYIYKHLYFWMHFASALLALLLLLQFQILTKKKAVKKD